jgi:hypothetical protein
MPLSPFKRNLIDFFYHFRGNVYGAGDRKLIRLLLLLYQMYMKYWVRDSEKEFNFIKIN